MFRPYTLEEGRILVRLARDSIREYLSTGRLMELPSGLPRRLVEDNYGVFTTIETIEESTGRRELRGCIGFPRSTYNVALGVIRSSVAAAVEDPRFTPLTLEELDRVLIEVSILSPMELLQVRDPREYLRIIEVGRHGIVVVRGHRSGLLLPQVPVEQCWDTMTYLSEGCMKAFLHPDCWLDEDTSILVYEAQIFSETKPGGDVVERSLREEIGGCLASSKGGST